MRIKIKGCKYKLWFLIDPQPYFWIRQLFLSWTTCVQKCISFYIWLAKNRVNFRNISLAQNSILFLPLFFSPPFFSLFLLYFFSLFSFFYFLFPLLFSFFSIILGNVFSVYNKYKAMFLQVILHFTHLQLAVLQFCLKVTSG